MRTREQWHTVAYGRVLLNRKHWQGSVNTRLSEIGRIKTTPSVDVFATITTCQAYGHYYQLCGTI